MKKIALLLLSTFLVCSAFAQDENVSTEKTDVIYKHSGEKLPVKIVSVGENTIVYKYPGEDAQQTIGRLAVAKIVYTSGRTEEISDKIVVSDKSDWEKVQIITDKAMALGLKKGDEVRGKTSGLLSYNTAGSADKKATRRIKEAAAEMGAPFVLLTSDKNDGFGVKQSIKNGVVYTYK